MHAALPGVRLRLHGAGFPVASPRAPGRSGHPCKEIADVVFSLSSQRRLLQFYVCSIKSEGNRRGRSPQKSVSDVPVKEDEQLKDSISSVNESSKSSSPEEMLALFRRIQASISKGEPIVRKKRSSMKRSQRPIPDAQRRRPNQKRVGDKISSQPKDQEPPQQSAILNKDGKTVDASSSEISKPSRPPSNFVKRSPIPLSSLPRENTHQVIEQEPPATVAEDMQGMQRIDGLKLSELKELAKSRGIKGYSKLKKRELLELLKGIQNSA